MEGEDEGGWKEMMREDGRRGKEGEEFQLSDSFVKLILPGLLKLKGLKGNAPPRSLKGNAPPRIYIPLFNNRWCLMMKILILNKITPWDSLFSGYLTGCFFLQCPLYVCEMVLSTRTRIQM